MAETESCFLCGENLEWVGYGPCGHQVCSTCIVRIRSISADLRCSTCRTQCDFVVVTKPLGDLNTRINGFPSFPLEANEGQVGPFWYHKDSKAFFDDFEEYTRIKSMCRILCTSCGETDFDCIGNLMNHLFERHGLFMCTVCLVCLTRFISEQKLFTRAQLNQHIRTGNSEVDGDLTERRGFEGHPKCEICSNPFYGDEEIFIHIRSTVGCSCHICNVLLPGLDTTYVEDHFHEFHIEPADGYWLASFSIVRAFKDEEELQWHNASEHGEDSAPPLRDQYELSSWFDPPTVQTSRVESRSGQNSGSSSTVDVGLARSSISNPGISASESSTASAQSSHHARAGRTPALPEIYDSDSPPDSPVQNRRKNKVLSEKIRDRLFKALKDTSRNYRLGLIDERTYLEYLNDHGLSDLVLDLAGFCRDSKKQDELVNAYIASLGG